MKLQIAIDIANTETVLSIADAVHDVIDILEVGTPVIMKEGLAPVYRVKQKYPNLCVLADTKIVDDGAMECEDACKAHADIVTVLAMADNATIKEVVETAHKFKKKVLADLICVNDIKKRAKELIALGVDYIGVHTGVDMQQQGRTPLHDLEELSAAVPHTQTAVAGGIKLSTIEAYVRLQPEILIAGGALYMQKDIRGAVIEMKGYLK